VYATLLAKKLVFTGDLSRNGGFCGSSGGGAVVVMVVALMTF